MNYKIGLSANLINKDPSKGVHDGLSVYTKNLWQSLDIAGANVVPYKFKDSAPDYLKQIFEFEHSYKYYLCLTMLNKGIAVADPKVDIFHVTDYNVVPMRCPVVTTLFDAIPFVQPELANSRMRKLKNLIRRRTASFSDHVIAISEFSVAELVEHYRIPEQKISVVPCGVDQVWLEPVDAQQTDKVLDERELNRGYFLTVGTLQPRKNLERLIAAHDLLSDQMRHERPLVVVGRPGWSCEALIEQLKAKCLLKEAVWLTDIESTEELRCLYAGAGAFVFPSLYEGFGLPVLEAFATGVQVLTSNTTSLKEVSMGIALEVDPMSVGEIAEGMKSLVTESDHAWRVAAGRKRASTLTWDHCARLTRAVYDAVLRNG